MLSTYSPPFPSTPALLHCQASGAPAQKVTLQTVEREGIEVDVTVAAEPLAPGDIALRVPEHLIVSWWLPVECGIWIPCVLPLRQGSRGSWHGG